MNVIGPSDDGLSDFRSRLGELWSRATGGSDVAASPRTSQVQNLPFAPSVTGASEAIDWLQAGFSNNQHSRMVFLIGGPGNGKSVLAIKCVEGLKCVDGLHDPLARRTYEYETASRNLLVVNDATIGLRSQLNSPLTDELNICAIQGKHLLANVNRGVLFEELSQSSITGPGLLVLTWLANEALTHNPVTSPDWSLFPTSDSGYVKAARLSGPDGKVIDIVAVLMDSCSLFEVRPNVLFELAAEDGPVITADSYSIKRFQKRNELNLDQVPAAALLNSVVSWLTETLSLSEIAPSGFLDPIRANLEILNNGRVRSGLLNIFRAGELSTGNRMTYRDLWGAISRVLVGNLTEQFESTDVSAFLARSQPTANDSLEQFRQAMGLADLRFFQSIYINGTSEFTERDNDSNPVLRITSRVDPLRDATPEWAEPVLQAFTGANNETSPLSNLKDFLLQNDPNNVFLEVMSSFDERLDFLYVEAVTQDSLSDRERRDLISWYGRYLSRMYATVNGIPAFREEIELWTFCWANQDLPESVGGPLRTLLLPAGNSLDRSFRLPVFDSRTVPIMGRSESPRLSLKVDQGWSLKPRKDGESLFVQLMEGVNKVVELELDFALMREALACREGEVGITEFTHSASPRLERFRAALLIPREGQANSYWVLDSGGDELVMLGTPHV